MEPFPYVEAQGAFDNNKIVPFSLLTKEKKQTIGNLIEDEVNGMQAFFDSYTTSILTFNKAEKAKKRQHLMDGLLRSAYPFISEGRALTSSLAPLALELPYNIKVLPKYLPEGEEDFTTLILGQLGEKTLSVKIWKDGSRVFCTCSHDFFLKK